MSTVGSEQGLNLVNPKLAVGGAERREASPEKVLQFVLKWIERDFPRLAAVGRDALQQLMRGGRPTRRGIGRWRHDSVVKRRVKRLVPRGRDPEAITAAAEGLTRFALRLMKPRGLTPEQRARLCKLAAQGKPSEITRTLLAWRYELPDRDVRRLQRTNVVTFRWH
jgi:hypothetical protein